MPDPSNTDLLVALAKRSIQPVQQEAGKLWHQVVQRLPVLPPPTQAPTPTGDLGLAAPIIKWGDWLQRWGQMVQQTLPPAVRSKVEDLLQKAVK